MTLSGIPVIGLTAPALLLVAVLMIFRGTLVTRREVNAKDAEIDYLRETCAEKDRTITDFQEAIAASNALIAAVLKVAEERQ